MPQHAIFLSGPIGAGKTTLGRALAARLTGAFIDGDDHADHDHPWYCSILKTSRAIVQTGIDGLARHDAVVIAYPLNCIGWIYFRRRFTDAGICPVFVTLRASFGSIVDPGRGREFSPDEQERIRTMIAEGYGERPFSDLIVDTDHTGFEATLEELEQGIRAMTFR